MQSHHLIFDSGSIPGNGAAITSVRLTKQVNTGENLTFGSVCSAMAEITLVCQDPACLPKAGSAFTLQRQLDSGERVTLGRFYVEAPRNQGYGSWHMRAFDPVSRLDQQVDGLLDAMTLWPCTLASLVARVCEACGVGVKPETLEQGAYLVQKITARQLTGRQILQWAGELSGQFCTANPEGVLEFGWYTPKDLTIGPGGAYYYYSKSLSLEDFRVMPVQKVILRQTASDVGTVYPDTGEGEAYTVTGNGLLTANASTDLLDIARGLYEKLRDLTYTPCSLEVPGDYEVAPGDILTLLDPHGGSHRVYIMKTQWDRFRQKLTCSGTASRGLSQARNYQNTIRGRVLELQTAVEGLKAENRDTYGNLSRLQLTVEGMESTVEAVNQTQSQLQTALTQLQQSAESLSLSVRTMETEGVSAVRTETGYTFDSRGLRIQKLGQEMENLLDNTGMYVNRGQDVILQANGQGVVARDVKAVNYLIVGDHARLEDYGQAGEDRTACFYVN